MPKKPFLKKLFKKNKFNPKNTSYNKEVSDLQKHALTNPISMSEAENDIETSYTDNTSTHIVIDTSNDNIDTSNTEINNVVNADNNADTNNISQITIQENIIDTSTTESIDTSNASDTDSNAAHTSLHIETDTSNNPIDTSNIDNNTSNDNIDTNNIHNTDTSNADDTSNIEHTSTINNTSYTENTNQVFHASYETYPNKKHEVLVDIKKSKPTKKNKKDKKSFREIITDNVNKVLGFFENIFIKEPLVYSLSYENNIACKLDDNMLVTRDGNLCVAMKLEGVSYASITQAREIDLAQARSQFFNTLDSSIEVNIFCKKELIDLEMRECKINNKYAEAIIKKWEYGTKAYKINYYLIFSTKTKRITGFFESKKRALTEERAESENKTQS